MRSPEMWLKILLKRGKLYFSKEDVDEQLVRRVWYLCSSCLVSQRLAFFERLSLEITCKNHSDPFALRIQGKRI